MHRGYNENRGWRILGERPITACMSETLDKLVMHSSTEFAAQLNAILLHGQPWENITQWTSGLGHA